MIVQTPAAAAALGISVTKFYTVCKSVLAARVKIDPATRKPFKGQTYRWDLDKLRKLYAPIKARKARGKKKAR